MTRFSFLCLLYISTASAQSIWVGVKGGLPLTQAFNAIENPQPLAVTAFYQNSEGLLAFDYDSATQRKIPYTVGPAVEIRLWRHIRVEADGLYSRAVFRSELGRPPCVRLRQRNPAQDSLYSRSGRRDSTMASH